MRRFGVLVAVVGLLATAACGSDTPVTAPPTTAAAVTTTPSTVSPTVAPTTTSPAAIEFSVDGAGPYQLGANLAQLQAAASLADVTAGGDAACPQNTTATGTGTWAEIHLSFRPDGRLYLLINRSTSIPSPSGAWLGTPRAELKKIYAAVTGQDLSQGERSAFLVITLNGRGILFELNEAQQVSAMYAGDAASLKTGFQTGKFC